MKRDQQHADGQSTELVKEQDLTIRQSTGRVLMVRPQNFGSNPETADSNSFQKDSDLGKTELSQKAKSEFDTLVTELRKAGIYVLVQEESESPALPDSVFPNNWITMQPDNRIYIFPMLSELRRLERRPDIVEFVRKNFQVDQIVDYSESEDNGEFLEGTGSMVLDHIGKTVYAIVSPRTHLKLLKSYASNTGYELVAFDAYDHEGKSIYHTNVLMCIGTDFATVCLEAIDKDQREVVRKKLESTGRSIIEISHEQMDGFAGNMIELDNGDSKVIAMSQTAWNSLNSDQKEKLEALGKIVTSSISNIENAGGGSVRCMIAEIFNQPTNL